MSEPVTTASAAQEAKAKPREHVPKLVLSKHNRGSRPLDRVAEGVNRFIGSMWVFVFVTIVVVVWLFAGNVVGFDKTPGPCYSPFLTCRSSPSCVYSPPNDRRFHVMPIT